MRIATLQKEQLPQTMSWLLGTLFFNDVSEPRFISITRARSVITLVADAELLDGVPGLTLDPTEWALIRVDENSVPTDGANVHDGWALTVPGIVATMTGPLASANIPVFHISTYDTEFLLVPHAKLEESLAPFSSADPAQEDVEERVSHTHAYPLDVLHEHPTTMLRLEKECRDWHTGALLRLLFFEPRPGEPEPELVSLTESPDNELSLIAGLTPWLREHCANISTGLSGVDLEEWVPICVKNADLQETGIVAAMASVLSASNISILGCSTLMGGGLATDFTLVPRSQVDEAATAFEKAGFTLQ